MMGYENYGNGGSYMTPSQSPSPSSNLSASAPPFTLDRSPKPGSIPAFDFVEPSYSSAMNSSLTNWLPGPTSDLNAYGYRGSQPIVESSSFSQSSESLAKKLPYYPPYLSPTTHKESQFLNSDQSGSICDYPLSSSDSKYGADWGLWKPLAEWKQSKQSPGSFGSKESADVAVPSMYENYMNADAKIPSGLGRVSDASHVVDFMGMEKHKLESLNDIAFSYKNVDYARSVLEPLSGLGETNHQSFCASSDQHSKHHSGSVSSAPFEIVHSQSPSGENTVFDSSLIREHLEREDLSSMGLLYPKAEETKSGPRISLAHDNGFNMNVNEVAKMSSVQESSDGADQYNHAVDSPCWKGVPIIAHSLSPYELPEAVQATHNSKVQEKMNEVGEQKSDCARLETDNSNAINRMNEGSSVPTVDVPRLVDTIHNLSELLLLQCTNGSSQLFRKDTLAVQSAMNNLNLCVSKNIEKRVPIQEPTLSEQDYDYPHRGFIVEPSEVTKRDRDMVDEDKATKAFKKVLTENFNEDETQNETLLYKNLWLEAEAVLCSLNYKARYNRMKVAMENSKLLKTKETNENTSSTDAKNKNPLLGSAMTPGSDSFETLLATKLPGLSASTPGSHDDDVMARFQILRCRVENSNHSSPTGTAADKPPSSSKEATSKTLLSEEKPTPKPEIPISGKNKDISDFDASVMARFHVLKSRGENFNNQSSAETKLARFASQRTNWPIIDSIPEVMCETSEEARFTAFSSEGQSRPNGPYGTENLAIQRASLDWEHVRKEDLGWQNR